MPLEGKAMLHRCCFVLFSAALTLGCEASETYAATVRFAPTEDKLPDPLEVPWPSDLYRTDADGTLADGIVRWTNAGLNPVRQALEAYGALDGFGRNAAAMFLLNEEVAIDAASLPAWGAPCAGPDASVALVDLDASADTLGERLPCYAGVSPGTRVLLVGPEQHVLSPHHTYAAVVTTRVTLEGGGKLGPSPAFKAIRDDVGTARSTAAGKLYGGAVDLLVRLAKLDRKTIAAVAVFTTQGNHPELKATRDAMVAGQYGPVPTLLTAALPAPLRVVRFGRRAHPGWTSTLSEWMGTARLDDDGRELAGFGGGPEPSSVGVAHDALGAVLSAAFPAPDFLRATTGDLSRSDGTIAWGASGAATAQGTATVPVLIGLPAAAAPASGYPVVIFQHGASHQRLAAGALANELARAGIATVAIDAPFHGLRAAGAVDEKNNAPGTYVGPDGLADANTNLSSAADSLGNFIHFLAMRDHLWQSALDLVQLRRLLTQQPDLSLLADEYGGVAPKLDLTRVGYVGMSMGGIIGSMIAAIEPRSSIDPLVLNVSGAGLVTLAFADGPQSGRAGLLVATTAPLPLESFEGRLRLLPNLGQGIFDGADPGSFGAELAQSDHNLWVLSADHDEALCNPSTDLLARSMQVTQLTPTLRPIDGLAQKPGPLRAAESGGRVHAFFGASPGHHGLLFARYATQELEPPWPASGEPRIKKLPSPSVVRQPVVGAQRAVAHFLTTTWAGAPEVAVDGPAYPGLLPVADFDDDGHCDDTERAAGTDPWNRASVPGGTPDCVRQVGFSMP